MKKSLPAAHALPMMMAELALSSWETIFRRSLMIAQGTCPFDEYQRMGNEKAAALHRSMLALVSGHGHAAMLAPFVSRTRANVRRLRRQG